jgi:hypothetical protein
MTKEEFLKLPQYLLDRVYLGDRTLGSIYDSRAGLIAKSLELPWRNNQRSVSCIPEGEYLVTKEKPIPQDDPSTDVDESGGRIYRPYAHFRLHNVPSRSGILIHRGVVPAHSQGCILVGSRFKDYDSETPSLGESGVKLQFMVDTMPDKFRLLIEAKSGTPYK